MKKHRGVFLALGLAALLCLSGREANAGNLTIMVSWTGGSFSFDWTNPVAAGDPNNGPSFLNLTDTASLNSDIAASGYGFSGLTASSNNPGDPTGSILRLTGVAYLNGSVTPPSALTVEAFQSDFTSPSGSGTLTSQASANFKESNAGSMQGSSGSLDSTIVNVLPNFTAPGGFDTHTMAANGNPSGYTLDSQVVITLVGPSGSGGASDQFTNNVSFAAVPEPASIVMMLTGMPLPLVVMGLLRRRRATA